MSEIVVEDDGEVISRIERTVTEKIREEMQLENQELAIRILKESLTGSPPKVEEIIEAEIERVLGGV